MIRLSICIATFNRARFIGETLDSIVGQLSVEVELVVVDGASSDGTEQVVRRYLKDPSIHYYREEINSGVDADYDKAVGYARGTHCWLMSDDDLLVPDAVAKVLEGLGNDTDLLIVDASVRDVTMTKILDERRMRFTGLRCYGPETRDTFLTDAGDALSFIGGTIVRRARWLERERAAYYGSLFIHVGVIFQQPPMERVRVLGQSLIIIRMGNAMWTPRSFEIWMFKWPRLIWGFEGYSDAAKAAVVASEPWRKPQKLLLFRASGALGRAEYRRFFAGLSLGLSRIPLAGISLLPGRLAHLATVALLSLKGYGAGSGVYNLLATSPYSNGMSRAVARLAGNPGASDQ